MSEHVEDFLAHYGVKGMQWGKRKAKDPYGSLDKAADAPGSNPDKHITKDTKAEAKAAKQAEKAVKRETKAKTFDERAANLDKRIKELDAELKALPPGAMNAYNRSHLTDIRKFTAEERDRLQKDAKAVREGKLTSTQKKVLIGAGVVAGLATAYVVQDQIQSGNATRLVAKGKERFSGEAFAFKKKPELSNSDFDVSDIQSNVLKHINPDYGAIGTKMNCRRATFSYEMRRRGYDVKATRTTNANGQNVLGLLNATSPGKKIQNTGVFNVLSTQAKESRLKNKYDNTPVTDLAENFAAGGKNKIQLASGVKSIFDTLSTQPDGSRGELGVMWRMGGGHSMAYEIVKGKPVVFDGQTGKIFENFDTFSKAMPSVVNAGFTRLDNIELNHDYLMRWMTNA